MRSALRECKMQNAKCKIEEDFLASAECEVRSEKLMRGFSAQNAENTDFIKKISKK